MTMAAWAARLAPRFATRRGVTRTVTYALGTMAMLAAAGCEPPRPMTDIRLWTDHYEIRVSSVPLKPSAELLTQYVVVVKDRKTGQPISGGEGRIFASNREKVKVDDGFASGPEVGTYHASIRFPSSGDWAFGVQFRRDSTMVLERTTDWIQTILPAPPLGSDTSKSQ